MTGIADPLATALADFGVMNFSVDCRVRDVDARLAMNDEMLFLAVAAQPVRSVLLSQATSSGRGDMRTLRLGQTQITVEFPDEADGVRLDRVLAARHAMRRAQHPTNPLRTGDPSKAVVATLSRQFGETVDRLRLASAALMVLGGLILLGGVVAAIVLFIAGAAVVGLLTLLGAVLSAATPLAIALLSQATLLRWALQDIEHA